MPAGKRGVAVHSSPSIVQKALNIFALWTAELGALNECIRLNELFRAEKGKFREGRPKLSK
jgi:hypothetical protein